MFLQNPSQLRRIEEDSISFFMELFACFEKEQDLIYFLQNLLDGWWTSEVFLYLFCMGSIRTVLFKTLYMSGMSKVFRMNSLRRQQIKVVSDLLKSIYIPWLEHNICGYSSLSLTIIIVLESIWFAVIRLKFLISRIWHRESLLLPLFFIFICSFVYYTVRHYPRILILWRMRIRVDQHICMGAYP